MMHRVIAGTWISAILLLAAGGVAAEPIVSHLQIPPAPELAQVAMPKPPSSFCTEVDRGRFLGQVFNPAVDTANANVAKANAHLDELSRITAAATAPLDMAAGRQAFLDYRPTADKAYQFGFDVLSIRPTIMSTPVVPCGPPPEQHVAAPPPSSHGYQTVSDVHPSGQAPPGPSGAPTGPKRTVAVGVIQASGGFDKSEDWSPGGALSSMLAKSLSDGGRVIVVERAQLDQVLNEQQLTASHVTGGQAQPMVKMIPAQYLVVGSVTEFGAPNSGGGLSIGGFGSSGFGGGLAFKKETGKISIDLRVINTRTGEVVNAFTVSKTVSRTGVSVTTDYRGLSVGSDSFNKTPLGEACREALVDAADRVADVVARSGWEAKVVEADGDDVVVNAGAEAGLNRGDRLRIEHIGRTLTDPDTGQVLSQRHDFVGELVIHDTDDKVAHGRFFADAPGVEPQRGDLVIFESSAQ
jgi:curli biogenesis system outer membrane secretion channel CsgG